MSKETFLERAAARQPEDDKRTEVELARDRGAEQIFGVGTRSWCIMEEV